MHGSQVTAQPYSIYSIIDVLFNIPLSHQLTDWMVLCHQVWRPPDRDELGVASAAAQSD